MNKIHIRMLLNVVLAAALLAASFLVPLRAQAGGGGGITINTTADNTDTDSLCSLREAIINSNNNNALYPDCGAGVATNDNLVFDPALGYATITLTSALPIITTGNILTIAPANRITISGNDLYRVFYVNTLAILNLMNLTVTHGYGEGGGLANYGTTNITGVTFSYNSSSGSGGGILNASILNVARSTFLGNTAGSDGGGLMNSSHNAQATISNSTFANNTAAYGGGAENNSGMLNILSSTFSGNSATHSTTSGGAISTWNGETGYSPNTYIYNTILANSVNGGDCSNQGVGPLTGSNNIIETTTDCAAIATLTSDPRLGVLKGSPAYFPLSDGSPAINAGDDGYCAGPPVSGTSQNGIPRPQGAHCDIGSVETSIKMVLKSAASYDGWVLESTATSTMGGTLNPTATSLRVGDDSSRKQYRSIMSFNTSTINDGAIITDVKLRIKVENTYGSGDPLTLLGGFKVDVRKGTFGLLSLQAADFQTTASKTVGPSSPPLMSRWYTINLYAARGYINKLSTNNGATQVRLRFTNGDNADSIADYISLFSGNAILANRPQLIVYYYIP